MGDTAVFAIELQDDASGAAETAAKSLLDLQEQIDGGKAALREMAATMRTLKGSGATEAIASLKEQMSAQRAVVQAATADYVSLGGGFGSASAKALAASAEQEALAAAEAAAAAKAQEESAALAALADSESRASSGASDLQGSTGDAASGLEGLAASGYGAGNSQQQLMDALKGTLGPMGGMFERTNMLSKGLGNVSVAAVGAVVAVVAVVAAVVAAAAKMTQFAIASADAARSLKITLSEAVQSAAGGDALAGAISRIAGEVPQTKAELASMATELAKTGLRGKELEAALESAAKKAAGAFGGAKMLSLDTQLAKAKENIAGLFEGINIEPFLAGLHSVLGLLGESTVTGQGLRTAMKGIFDPVMAALAWVAPIAKSFLQGLTIGALQVAVVFLKIKNAISGAFGGGGAQVNLMAIALKGAQYLVIALGAVFAVVGAVVGAVVFVIVGVIGAVTKVIQAVVAVVGALSDAFSWLGNAAGSAWDGISSGLASAWSAVTGFVGQFMSAGANLITGLVQGIASGASAVMDALLAPVKAGINGVKGLLGIHSPSKVFAGIGANTAAGFVEGIDAGAGNVADATKSMVSIPSSDASAPKAAGAKASAGGAGGGARTYNITINGVRGAEELREPSFLAKLAAELERATTESGAPMEVALA